MMCIAGVTLLTSNARTSTIMELCFGGYSLVDSISQFSNATIYNYILIF